MKLTLPKKIGTSVKKLEILRRARKETEIVISDMKKDEKALEAHIYLLMKKEDIAFTRGESISVSIVDMEVPEATDWPALYKYITKTGNFDLLHKRLTIDAFKDRWDDGKAIPGVKQRQFQKLTVRQA